MVPIDSVKRIWATRRNGKVIGGPRSIFFRSDQLAFIRKGIPAVFFTTQDHKDYHRPSDEAEKVDNDKAARVARLAFLLAYHVAQDPTAPEWTEEGWAQVQELLGQSGG